MATDDKSRMGSISFVIARDFTVPRLVTLNTTAYKATHVGIMVALASRAKVAKEFENGILADARQSDG
jgi:hypothetical protein